MGVQWWNAPQDYWLVKTREDSQPGINGGLTPKMSQQNNSRPRCFPATK